MLSLTELCPLHWYLYLDAGTLAGLAYYLKAADHPARKKNLRARPCVANERLAATSARR